MTEISISIFACIILAAPVAYGTVVDSEGRMPSGFVKLTEQVPVPKHGRCPPGWRESGSYCVTGEDTKTQAVPKVGSTCPAAWITSGSLLHPALAAVSRAERRAIA
jgi:hypothetical protein